MLISSKKHSEILEKSVFVFAPFNKVSNILCSIDDQITQKHSMLLLQLCLMVHCVYFIFSFHGGTKRKNVILDFIPVKNEKLKIVLWRQSGQGKLEAKFLYINRIIFSYFKNQVLEVLLKVWYFWGSASYVKLSDLREEKVK